jgi:hypothetical protein
MKTSPISSLLVSLSILFALLFLGVFSLTWKDLGFGERDTKATTIGRFRAIGMPTFELGRAEAEFDVSEYQNEDTVEDEERLPLAYVPDEILLRVATEEELFRLLRLAMAQGGEFIDAVPALKTIRLRFADADYKARFRDQLGDAYEAENNYLVKTPDYPEYETREESDQMLTSFGVDALDWIGISGDHSEWGKGVVVAVLDSGVYPHVSFEGMTISQMNLLDDVGAEMTNYDSHGTAVASISAQVAPAAEILSVRVLDSEGIGDSYTVASGIVAAVDFGALVINLSIGSYTDSSILSDAVAYAVDQGVVVVAASGNDGSNAPSYPAAYEGVVSVSAVDADGQIADFSNFGDTVDLAAPGVGVYAAWDETAAIAMSGTSAAAPFVSGAVAALLSSGQASTGAEAIDILEANAIDLGDLGVDSDSGYGALQLGGLF